MSYIVNYHSVTHGFRCTDMDSGAVILSIGSSGNRLRLHLSRNPAAASNPRLASPN